MNVCNSNYLSLCLHSHFCIYRCMYNKSVALCVPESLKKLLHTAADSPHSVQRLSKSLNRTECQMMWSNIEVYNIIYDILNSK